MVQKPHPRNQGYDTSAPMVTQTTTAVSYPRPIAPAPIGGRGPSELRPILSGGAPTSCTRLPIPIPTPRSNQRE